MSYIKTKEPIPYQMSFGTVNATTTKTFHSNCQFKGEVVSIEVWDNTAQTADNTNRFSFSFNKGSVATPTAIQTLDMNVAGGGLTANVAKVVSVAAVTDATKRVTTTDLLHAVMTKNGAPTTVTDLWVTFWVIPTYDFGNALT